jgi:hypothetical protein
LENTLSKMFEIVIIKLNSFEKTFWWSCKYKSRSKKFTCPFGLVPMKFLLSSQMWSDLSSNIKLFWTTKFLTNYLTEASFYSCFCYSRMGVTFHCLPVFDVTQLLKYRPYTLNRENRGTCRYDLDISFKLHKSHVNLYSIKLTFFPKLLNINTIWKS